MSDKTKDIEDTKGLFIPILSPTLIPPSLKKDIKSSSGFNIGPGPLTRYPLKPLYPMPSKYFQR